MAGWLSLQPAALIRYQRMALVGRSDPSTRVTIDRDIDGAFRPASCLGPQLYRSISNINATGTNGVSGRYAMLELKCNNVVPGWFHRTVQDLELTRTAYSKYYLVVLALRASLIEDCDVRFAEGSDD